MKRVLLAWVVAFLITGLPALASEADWAGCTYERQSAESRLAACSRILNDPGVTGDDRARALFWRGMARLQKLDSKAAAGDLTESIGLRADDANTHYWLGRALSDGGDSAGALKRFDEAVRLRPRWPAALNARGVAHARLNRPDSAIADYTEAIKEDPQFLLAYKNRGEALRLLGKAAEAKADFVQVLAAPARPGNIEDTRLRKEVSAYLEKLQVKAPPTTAADHAACEKGRGDARVEACSRIIGDAAAKPTDQVVALMSRAGVYYERRQYEAVLGDMDRLLKIAPDNGAAYARRGSAKVDLNRTTDSIADYDQAIRLSPLSAWYLNSRGNVHRSLGQFDRAMADYDAAIRLESGYLWPIRNRAVAHERLGLFDEAEAGFRRVVEAVERPGNADDRRAKLDAGNDLKRLAALKDARSRTEVRLTRRVALVIANTKYTGSFDALATPAGDGRAVAAALKLIGFKDDDVIEKHDLDRRGMIAALREFEGKARTADWAMVFFAGHGVRARSNLDYMIPIDAHIESERDLADEAVALERVVERIGDAKKLQLVVFDACRSNELTRRLYSLTDQQRSAAQSAAPFEAPGLILAFSARRGQSAFDGKTNSPFVEALLASMDKPGVDLESVLTATAEQVKKVTGEQQVPEIYGLGYGKGVVLRAGR